MGRFSGTLKLEQRGDRWWVAVPIVYHCNNKQRVAVPKNFSTDLASIPRVLWSIVGHPAGRYAAAAVVHDYLYRQHTTTRVRADRILLEACKTLEVSAYQRWALYLGVRMGGRAAWG